MFFPVNTRAANPHGDPTKEITGGVSSLTGCAHRKRFIRVGFGWRVHEVPADRHDYEDRVRPICEQGRAPSKQR